MPAYFNSFLGIKQGFSKLGHRQSQGIRWHGGEVL
jgi:hypothetical protein